MPKSITKPPKAAFAAAQSGQKLPSRPPALAAGLALGWRYGWRGLGRAGLRLAALPGAAAINADGRSKKETCGGGAVEVTNESHILLRLKTSTSAWGEMRNIAGGG